MTDKVNPSVNRPAEAFTTAGAIAYGGGSGDGYIVESQSTTEMSIQSPDINESSLNEFSQTNSGLDVSISGGEAFVFGAWLAIDEVTVVTLPPSTTSTVHVGWNRDGSDDVIIGLDSAFNDASGEADQKIPLFTFDTNSTVVTSVTDERRFDQIPDVGEGNIANSGTVVTESTDEIDFTDNLVASDDGDGTTSVTLSSEVLARIFKSEDLSIHGKTLESGDTITLGADEGAVVSERYTVDGTLNIEKGGSITVI